jgi:hypothetical protein
MDDDRYERSFDRDMATLAAHVVDLQAASLQAGAGMIALVATLSELMPRFSEAYQRHLEEQLSGELGRLSREKEQAVLQFYEKLRQGLGWIHSSSQQHRFRTLPAVVVA